MRFLLILMGITLWSGLLAASPAGLSNAPDETPTAMGFHQFYKCGGENDVISLGDTVTVKACLAQCQKLSRTFLDNRGKGCWWLDGSGGFPRDCRVCRTTEPVKQSWPNDWARPLSAELGL